MNDDEFKIIVAEAIDKIPELYAKKLNNVAFVIEDEPTPDQRQKLKLACNQTLFGLYEGIPLTKRGSGYNLVLPDKITIFKLPLMAASQGIEDFKKKVQNTVWHEVAHYYGLDHARIHKLENAN